MSEVFLYWLLQSIGYRLYCFDLASARGIKLDAYSGWFWRPWLRKGTYREQRYGFFWAGYGVDQ